MFLCLHQITNNEKIHAIIQCKKPLSEVSENLNFRSPLSDFKKK